MGKSKANEAERVRKAGNWLSAALVITVVAGAAVGQHFLRRAVSNGPHQPVEVAFAWPLVTTPEGQTVTWMSEPIRRSIERVALLNLTADPLDSTALKLTADALAGTGWFDAAPSVRRVPGGRVEVRGAWRAPVAVVRHATKDHLVSAKARLLPLSYAAGTSGLKFIDKPSTPPPAQPGEPWLGGDVDAALALLGILQNTPADAQVAGIDVGEYVAGNKKRLVIITDKGNRIIWGIGPNEVGLAEPTTQVKLQRLLALRSDSKHGWRIDADHPVIDLTNPRGIMVQRMAPPSMQGTGGPDADAPTIDRANNTARRAQDEAAGGGRVVRTASRDR